MMSDRRRLLNTWCVVAIATLCAVSPVMARAGARTASDVVAPPGLSGSWLLDEGSGSDIHDSSGNGNDGGAHGTTWTSGVAGGALHFAGTTARVVIPSSPSLATPAVTVAAWVRADADPGPWRVLVFKGVTNCLGSSFALKSSGTGGLVFGIYDGSVNVFSPDAGTGVWDGAWHLLAGTFDGERVRLFVDGELVGGTPTSIAIRHDLADGTDLVIGHPVSAPACPSDAQFTGDIDEVRTWGRALTAPEVASLLPERQPTTTILVSSPAPSGRGVPIRLVATVAPADSSGQVEFRGIAAKGSTLLGTARLTGGTAQLAIQAPVPGLHTYLAVYKGDATHASSSSDRWRHRVLPVHELSRTGKVGSYRFTDTRSDPGGRCTYAANYWFSGLTAVSTDPIQAAWPSGLRGGAASGGRIGWRLTLQGDDWDSEEAWTYERNTKETVVAAGRDRVARFRRTNAGIGGAGDSYRVIGTLTWYSRSGTVLGRVRLLVDHYASVIRPDWYKVQAGECDEMF